MKKLLLATALVPLGTLAYAQCAPDFSDVTLTISTQNGPFIASALQAAADSWEAQDLRQGRLGRVSVFRALSEVPDRDDPADR